jgi:hypothetical protein
MIRAPFSNPEAHMMCPKCRHFGTPAVSYRNNQQRYLGGVFDEWLELSCQLCGYEQEMAVKS